MVSFSKRKHTRRPSNTDSPNFTSLFKIFWH